MCRLEQHVNENVTYFAAIYVFTNSCICHPTVRMLQVNWERVFFEFLLQLVKKLRKWLNSSIKSFLIIDFTSPSNAFKLSTLAFLTQSMINVLHTLTLSIFVGLGLLPALKQASFYCG